MAEEAELAHAALIHYSTDYVFDGRTERPYTEDDPPHPINAYGETKLAGEEAIRAVGGAYLILRTSWLYSFRKRSFPVQVLDWARTQEVMRVVEDQVGSPTWCRMLAQATASLLARGMDRDLERIRENAGVYHLAGQGTATRLEWARLILQLDPRHEEQVVQEVVPALSTEFATAARRPAFCALDCSRFARTFGFQLPDWRDALRVAMAPER
jgi:dTDP-4-dehydrorhamnose reductase